MIAEIHSTHLTNKCLRKVQLTAAGKAIGTMPSALYFGNLWHEACGLAHLRDIWQIPRVDALVIEATELVEKKAVAENRPLTDAVKRDITSHQSEVVKLLGYYGERCAPLVKTGRLLGVEVPVRLTLDIDGEPAEFASHVDLLWQNRAGELEIWDWKTGDDAPNSSFLARNLQMGLYWLAGIHGSFYVDGFWTEFGQSPRMTWVHVPNLHPYTKRTTGKDDNGEDREFQKGEHRPIRRILNTAYVEDEKRVVDEIAVRVRMFRAGLYPTNPDPVGCMNCECWQSCPTFQGENR